MLNRDQFDTRYTDLFLCQTNIHNSSCNVPHYLHSNTILNQLENSFFFCSFSAKQICNNFFKTGYYVYQVGTMYAKYGFERNYFTNKLLEVGTKCSPNSQVKTQSFLSKIIVKYSINQSLLSPHNRYSNTPLVDLCSIPNLTKIVSSQK